MSEARAPRALICDLDMTLIDSRRDIAQAVLRALRAGCDLHLEEEQVYPWIGRPLHRVFAGLARQSTPIQIEQCVEFYRKDFFENCCRYSKPYPGVVETLETLGRREIRRAVASNKMSFMVRRVCQALRIDRLFEHFQGTDEFPHKPDPAMIENTCRVLGVTAGETVVIGDTAMDLQAGKNAGCRTVAVTYGIASKAELEAEKPDLIIEAFPEVITLFSGGPELIA